MPFNKNTFQWRYLSVLLVIFLMLVGCQTVAYDIRSDGVPIPDNVVRLTNPETGIEITFMFVRLYRQYEGKEYIVMPDYIDPNAPHVINPRDTERLEMHIKVFNPNRVRYEMWEDYSLHYKEGRWPTMLQKCFYDGSLSVNNFVVKLPVKDQSLKKIVAAAKMRGNSGRFLIWMGPLTYELKEKH